MSGGARVIELEEGSVAVVPAAELEEREALLLHRRYGRQIEVGFPSPISGPGYRLRSRGYVGQFPLGRTLQVRVNPKVPLRSLFGMLEYAYQLRSFRLWEGCVRVDSVGEIFERLAAVLAGRVLDRLHGGLLQDYVEREERLNRVRGRLLFGAEKGPGQPDFGCRFYEQTADLPDNRILAWTLYQLRRHPFGREAVRAQVRQAFRLLAGKVELVPVAPDECVGRVYHRLNHDYRFLHALCRLLLEQSGPALESGEREFAPFSVYMPALFEAFVAGWLETHLAGEMALRVQHRVPLEGSPVLAFRIDLALEEQGSGKCLAVLDTKYKAGAEPEEEDIHQVVAYAVRMGTQRAFLVYPGGAVRPQRFRVGPVEVRTLVFDVGEEVERAGSRCLEELLACMGRAGKVFRERPGRGSAPGNR